MKSLKKEAKKSNKKAVKALNLNELKSIKGGLSIIMEDVIIQNHENTSKKVNQAYPDKV